MNAKRMLDGSVAPMSAAYTATMHPDGKRFTIRATGENPTTGYKTFLQVDPILILPEQVDFVNIKPTGMAGQMISPFDVELTLVANSILGQPQRGVIVHDTNGGHSIPIQ
jgi:hypothetical protein